MPKNQVKPLQPEVVEAEIIPPVAMKPERSYTFEMIEAVVNKYYASKGSKTPLLIERSDLLTFVKANL